ncbi:MAG: DUF3649 domain-containing protein [Comamonas sp.]
MSKSASTIEASSLNWYRAKIASRSLAAIGGGYALAAASAAAGSLGFQHLGLSRSDATMAATMLSFIVYAVAAMWCFGCTSTRRAWAGCAIPALALALLAWLLKPGGPV